MNQLVLDSDSPTLRFIMNMREAIGAMDASFSQILDVAMKLTEDGLYADALDLVDVVRRLQMAERIIRQHGIEAENGLILRMNRQ